MINENKSKGDGKLLVPWKETMKYVIKGTEKEVYGPAPAECPPDQYGFLQQLIETDIGMQNAVRNSASLLEEAYGWTEKDFWEKSYVEALARLLKSISPAVAIAASVGYLQDMGHIETEK